MDLNTQNPPGAACHNYHTGVIFEDEGGDENGDMLDDASPLQRLHT